MSETPADEPATAWRIKPLLQLLRLPNVFTAIADVMMGYLIVRGGVQEPERFIPLVLASISLYLAGMVLNDVYDLEVDRRERPYRPLPSGKISLALARRLGFSLLVAGIVCGWVASLAFFQGGQESATAGAGFSLRAARPGIVATLLAICVFAYDALLKRTPLAPLAMGGCRMLNVLLGMSADPAIWVPFNWLIASGIGVYIVGVTWFARTEARGSSPVHLAFATAVALAGIALLARAPLLAEGGLWTLKMPEKNWNLLWGTIGVLIGWRMVRAVFQPEPHIVQPAVKVAILSIVMIDACICLGVLGGNGPAGMPWAVIVLALLAPAMLLGRWIYST